MWAWDSIEPGHQRSLPPRRGLSLLAPGSRRALRDGSDALGFDPDRTREGLAPGPVQDSHVADQVGAHVRFLSRAWSEPGSMRTGAIEEIT